MLFCIYHVRFVFFLRNSVVNFSPKLKASDSYCFRGVAKKF